MLAVTQTSISADRLRLGGTISTGILVILVFFGVFGGWAAMMPLSSAVLATGVFEVEDQRKLVQHLEGGIVAELAVREGKKVTAGDVLISLDTTQPRARLALLEGRLVNRLALAGRLRAERDGSAAIEFPEEFRAIATESARDAARVQTQVFEARRLALEGQSSILKKRIEQTGEEIIGLEQLIEAHDRLIVTLQQEAGDLEGLFEEGLTTRERYMALRRRQAELEGERAVHIASIARAGKSMSELEQQIAELSVTRLNQAVDELSQVEADLLDLHEQIRSATDVLQRAEIRAPASGTVMNLKVHSTRGVVNPGEPLMEIVPTAAHVVLKAQIRPEDVDEVTIGQTVEVRLRSRDGRDQPPLDGLVASVSADRFVDERTGQGYFVAVVEFGGDGLQGEQAWKILPGTGADITIGTGARTLVQYILDPLLHRINLTMRES